jgi:NAD(P)-dependent dehydrogenase (short-subunit alcohol dehydrogenase family)
MGVSICKVEMADQIRLRGEKIADGKLFQPHSYVNNAGICGEAGNATPIDEASEDMLDSHLTVNVKGTFFGCKYALRQMKKQEPHARGDRGWIVNLSSTIALVGMTGLRE